MPVEDEVRESADQDAAARQVRETVTAMFQSRLEALQAAHEHIKQFDDTAGMPAGARIGLEIELASYLAGAPRVSVGASSSLGGLIGRLGSLGAFLASLTPEDTPADGTPDENADSGGADQG